MLTVLFYVHCSSSFPSAPESTLASVVSNENALSLNSNIFCHTECHFSVLYICVYVLYIYIYIYTSVLCLVAQPCPTLCHPLDCSLPGSSVHGILQARILEWVAMPSSGGSSQRRDQTQAFCTAGRFFYCLKHQGSPRILEWVACPFSRGAC